MMRCNELESDLAELRAAYDLYFQGVDRLPPLKKHDLFKKGYAKLKGSQIRQTAAKFRIETIGQKLLTYERLWDRTLKEIENGTYKRDLAKLKRKDQRQHQKPKSADSDSAFDVDEDLDLSDLDDEGDGDLAAALAAAEAAAARPSAPAIRPVTSLAPAITPVTPPGGVKPLTGPVPAVTPLPPAGGVRLTPAIPVVTPAGGVRLTSAIPRGDAGGWRALGSGHRRGRDAAAGGDAAAGPQADDARHPRVDPAGRPPGGAEDQLGQLPRSRARGTCATGDRHGPGVQARDALAPARAGGGRRWPVRHEDQGHLRRLRDGQEALR